VRAQKIMNMGVKRLQEMLGPEAITREAVTPRLNLDRVSVDLLRAHSLLRESVVNAHTGPLMRAVDQLGAALDIAAGKPLFPGLDGEMFIAAREDFIGTLRSAVVEVARMMVEEGEGAGVEPVLRRVLELFPDDAEIVGLLGERYDPDSDDLFPSHPASRSTVMQTETFLFATMPAAARSYRPGAA
jgi:hypothetical protein